MSNTDFDLDIGVDTNVNLSSDNATVIVVEDFNTEVLYVPQQGPPGLTGPPGTPGKNGNGVIYGAGPPNQAQGMDGDFYIDTNAHYVYGPKQNNTWPPGTSMVGPQGPRGNSVLYGVGVPANTIGIDGDFYVDTNTHMMYGPKASSAWPAGFSLIGPPGVQGPPGVAGPPGAQGTVYIQDTPPTGTIADNSMWWNSSDGRLYIRYNDGTSTQWVVAVPVPENVGYTRYDIAQALTVPQLVQARQNIYAAPFDAMASTGLQVNGAMEVNQMLNAAGAAIAIPTGAWSSYLCENWQIGKSSAVAVGNAYWQGSGGPPGIPYYLQASFTTGFGAPAAGDYCSFVQGIEGYRWGRLSYGTAGALSCTFGFWVYASAAGAASLSIRNYAGNRSYTALFNINNPNTWEYKTITVPGDTAGTWPTGNAGSAMIAIMPVAGSTYIAAAAGVWAAGNFLAAPGQGNLLLANGSNFGVTGLTITPGIEAPKFDRSPFIQRHHSQELITCRRYWQRIGGDAVEDAMMCMYAGAAGTLWGNLIPYPGGEMRAIPALSFVGTWAFSNATAITTYPGMRSFGWYLTCSAAGQGLYYNNAANSYIALNARI